MNSKEMFEGYNFAANQPGLSLLKCLLLAVMYVGSLYIRKSPHPRDHPDTIKQRMRSVAFVCLFAPVFVYMCANHNKDSEPLFHWLGFHTNNIAYALFLPLLLTVLLFLGPIVLCLLQDEINVVIADVKHSIYTNDLKWYRTYIVAPFTEEFIFRACMLPIIVPNFGLNASILIAPLFFGVAHFHHIIEQLKFGNDLFTVLITSAFQMSYTTLFGAYTAFLYLRTGHLVGPVVCHSFCNMMGFPDFGSISLSKYPKMVWFMFIIGLVLFIYLLFPLTSPSLYESIYWR